MDAAPNHAAGFLAPRVTPAPHVAAAAQGGEIVLLDARRGRYYTLNEVGSRIWALLSERAAPAAIVERIAAEYDAPVERVAADVAGLIARLLAQGLVEPGGAE